MDRAKNVSSLHCKYLPVEVEGFDSLAELALDLRWSWNHSADDVWRQIDPELWELTHNPWLVLLTVSRTRLQTLARDEGFRRKVSAVLQGKRQAEERSQWFRQAYPGVPLTSVAYFSMEFMLTEAMPVYCGGLGNVAGDQFKAASCLGVPVVGVGLLYQQGYFRQVIGRDGAHQALYPYNDPWQLSILPVRDQTGEWLRIEVSLPGSNVWLRAWQVQAGRLMLYLLDTNDPANPPVHRGINGEIYGGGPELRLKQELMLGIGGWRPLRKLGMDPEVCHLNEGHAAFAVLERARCFMEDNDRPRGIFNPDVLTMGFARRFVAYKRPNLLLHDRDRLIRILADPHRPAQLVIAGKPHPADLEGQAMIAKWVRFIQRPEVAPHVIFLGDYDMDLTEQLVQGVDLWINTPRRPWEACGTSGMKVLVNGGLNLSELGGWWAEAYTPDVGWALGDGKEHDDDPAWDAYEADQLYGLLEREVIPAFYTRDEDGLPTAWLARLRESMARLTGQFSANRTVREYTGKYYLPAAAAYCRRAAKKGLAGVQVVNWQRGLIENWSNVRFGSVNVRTDGKQHVFEVQVYLGGLDPHSVSVELYADGRDGGGPVRQKMKSGSQGAGLSDGYVYRAKVPATRPAADYTPRIIPHHADVSVPLEAGHILWQR